MAPFSFRKIYFAVLKTAIIDELQKLDWCTETHKPNWYKIVIKAWGQIYAPLEHLYAKTCDNFNCQAPAAEQIRQFLQQEIGIRVQRTSQECGIINFTLALEKYYKQRRLQSQQHKIGQKV